MLGLITAYLINPNCVIGSDDKGFFVHEPHCQIIFLLSYSTQSKKKTNSCQYAQDIETLAFNEGCAPDTRIGNSALGVKKL